MHQAVTRAYRAETRELFHCHCKIKIPIHYGEELIEQAFAVLAAIDREYNSYQTGSHFDRINQQAGQWVQVDEDCVALLKTLLLVSELTAGSYDITCMPLIRLWGFYQTNNLSLPSSKDLAHTLASVDYRKMTITDDRVKIAPGQELISGSFIKAFAVDRVIEFLRQHGVTDAIINAGGSTIRCINDEVHVDWKVNIPNAFQTEEYVTRIKMRNQCFSLSAMQHNSLLINGVSYGHILNSRKGIPASTVQVGVLTDEAFIGDVLSTALFTVDREDLEQTVQQLKKHFVFNYFRIEADGSKTMDECF